MPFDAHKNLAIATVTVAPAPAASGVTLTLGAGEGARFPAVPFNATIWPADALPTPSTAEVVRVTALTGDQVTAMTRGAEGTIPRAVLVGDLFAATITAKTITDVESGVNFPLVQSASDVWTAGHLVMTHPTAAIRANTADGADSGSISLNGGGSAGAQDVSRGAWIRVAGNEAPGYGGKISILAGNNATTGVIDFYTGAEVHRGRIGAAGGWSIGNAIDPGAGNLSVTGEIIATVVRPATNDGADGSALTLFGGGGPGATRGGSIRLYGNEAAQGVIQLISGDGGRGVEFMTGAGSPMRGIMHPSGGFSWGGTTDPGAGTFQVFNAGNGHSTINANVDISYRQGTASRFHTNYDNDTGVCGGISTNGTATAYNTSSDQRLKTDRGLITDPDVLRRTRVHSFTWNTDNTPGRGVFAQEAIAVLPSAVSIGTDERDESGNLKHPWGVDYSKYVPDLIAGWQHHDQRFEAMTNRIAFLEGAITAMRNRRVNPPPPATDVGGLYRAIRAWVTAWWARPSWV